MNKNELVGINIQKSLYLKNNVALGEKFVIYNLDIVLARKQLL